MSIGHFAGGFLKAFTAARDRAQQSAQDEKEKKARVQLFEIQLEREKAAQAQQAQQAGATQTLLDKISTYTSVPPSTPQDGVGPTPGPRRGLVDMMVDPEVQKLMVQSGQIDLPRLMQLQNPVQDVPLQGGGIAQRDPLTNTLTEKVKPIGGAQIGNYNPGDYTPGSFAKFLQTHNPADLKRQFSPQQMMFMANGSAGLEGNGLDLAAENYRLTGQLPPGLSRVPGAITKIITRSSELAAAQGNDAQATVLNRQAVKANQNALTQLTKQKTLVGAFEKTTLKNLDLVLQESAKVGRTGTPAINRWILAGKKNVLGDPEVARLHVAVASAMTEYAKVLSGATGAAGITDAARAEANSLLSSANTPEQIIGIIDLMKQEMHNRMVGFDEQEHELKQSTAGGLGATPPSSPGAKTYKHPSGATVEILN